MGKKKDAQTRIGQTLQNLREDKGVSNYRISEETGLSRGQIKAIMEGEGNPTIKTVDKVCNYLECELKIEKK